MFDSLSDRLGGVFDKLRGRGALKEDDVRAAMREVRIALLEADVALPVVRRFIDAVTEKAVGHEVLRSVTPGQQVVKIVHDELVEMLGGETPADLDLAAAPPVVIMMVGLQGSGKTTSTAKIAAAFATRYGAAHLGLITLDAYRMAAHEQLRAYGRILGVPVHTAHDRASLDDLLELLSGKKLVLIDTAGMAQRDERTAELLEMLSHRMIQRILVLNAGAQGETVEDVMQGYAANRCRGAIVSKIDEAAKIAPTLDALIRHKLRVLGVANGQRVPEDFHRLSSAALIERALRATPNPAWRVEPSEINLVFAAQARGAGAPLHA